jgi:uncharacterized radical SAM superfamily Fe-S cluster-containing enzyme
VDCCETAGARRPDRPHLFLHHELSSCATCGDAIEGRVVLRNGAVATLVHCPRCGATEHATHASSDIYLQEFLARAEAPAGHTGDHQFKTTTSTCPTCLALLTAKVMINDNKVFFAKDCPSCGPSRALVSEDAAYYVRAYAFARSGTQPFKYSGHVEHGCPTDCGTCDDHEQHTCLPIIEITDHCNLECPVCIVDNQYSWHMAPDTFKGVIDAMLAAEGQCESIALSGGEPTSHPQLLELIDHANRPEVGRVMLITNGLRLGKDRKLAAELKKRGTYVGLQLDGFDAASHTIVRGRDLTDEKAAALAMLREFQIPTQIIFVAVKGVNDHQLGQAVDLLFNEDFVISLNFQPVAHTGHGGGVFQHDPLDRMTIPGVIKALDAQSGGRLKYEDFYPLPCSHPQCVSLTYLLRMPDGDYLPFPRFVDYSKHTDLLKSSATLPATKEVHEAMLDVIHDVFANADTLDRGEEVLAALRGTIRDMFPDRKLTQQEQIRIGERNAKSIFMHAYMDRHDFDLERLRKCCHHYPQADGRVMPACGFNMFHRGAAKGPGTVRPEWATVAAEDGRKHLRVMT